MEIYSLPDQISAVCFDIDKTLYTNDGYAESQVTVLMERLRTELGGTTEEAASRVAAAREKIRAAGQTASLGNTFAKLGIPIKTSVAWRVELIRPADYLRADARLRETLSALKEQGLVLASLTNNPEKTGRDALDALGVLDLFLFVAGLDTTMQSKPSPEPFRWVLDKLEVPASQVVFVGDRYGVDLAPALALGTGGVLVSGVEEVYELVELLGTRVVGAQI